MTLLPEKHDFTIWRGGTFRTRLSLFEDEEATIPRPLAGYTAHLIIRERAGGDPLLTLNTENGGITLDADGNIDLFISDEVTETLIWKTGFYDLIITGPTGDSDPLLYGKFTVKGV